VLAAYAGNTSRVWSRVTRLPPRLGRKISATQEALVRASSSFPDATAPLPRRALRMASCGKCKQNRGILVVIPLSEKYLSLVRGFFPQNSKTSGTGSYRICRSNSGSRTGL
jgi:hypothetical protein